MAGYHSFELAFLSTVYSNLLTTKEPMDLWFSPLPGVLPNNTLRVSPDILPPGSIRIGEVELDGKPYADFDADGLTVHVPDDKARHKIRVRVVPTIDPFEVHTKFDGDVAEMTLTGKLDMSTFAVFQGEVESVLAKKPSRLVLNLQDLDSIANVGIRVLLFARQRMEISDRADIYAVAPQARGQGGAAARRSGPGRHQRRGKLRPVPRSRRPRQAPEVARAGHTERPAIGGPFFMSPERPRQLGMTPSCCISDIASCVR